MATEKVILTDADGVLFNWVKGFSTYMELHGYSATPEWNDYSVSKRYGINSQRAQDLIREYNEGPLIEFLEPLRDSVEYVRKLSDHGFKFVCITALSKHPESKIKRQRNLDKVFGNMFSELHCLEMGESKKDFLEAHWKDSGLFWIEDNHRQAEDGHNAGLKTILIRHSYNEMYAVDKYPTVGNEEPWAEIYKIICTEYNITPS